MVFDMTRLINYKCIYYKSLPCHTKNMAMSEPGYIYIYALT